MEGNPDGDGFARKLLGVFQHRIKVELTCVIWWKEMILYRISIKCCLVLRILKGYVLRYVSLHFIK